MWMILQQIWPSGPGHGTLDLMTLLCGGLRNRKVSTGRERRSRSPPQSTAKWGVWQPAQTHTTAFLCCQRKLKFFFFIIFFVFFFFFFSGCFTSDNRIMVCSGDPRAGRYLFLQGVCVGPGQQSALTWSNHSGTNHDPNNSNDRTVPGQLMHSWSRDILEEQWQKSVYRPPSFSVPTGWWVSMLAVTWHAVY